MYVVQAGSHFNILDVVDKGEHARKRRLLSNAFATRNLEQWEFKVSDKVGNLLTQIDKRCTAPLPGDELPRPEDLTIDWRKWSNLFTVDAIADIGCSELLCMLAAGDDIFAFDDRDGVKRIFSFVKSLHGGVRAASTIVWATDWFHILKPLTNLVSRYFNEQWQDGRNFNMIVSQLVKRRMERYQNGEKLDDFLSCLIENKREGPLHLDRGEIEAEVSIMSELILG